MAHPKRKTSKARRNLRRSHHGIEEITLVTCPNCGSKHRYHHVCMSCGMYRGRKVLNIGATQA
ncbi:MAG TPA: 50S ribosomal protein L32 [Bacteroidetes bacterium]|nr:50S ribosomal protein L32 [Bacteroidota bacterium]RCL68197.1 MAG: 50S ribosomal protein L32 [Rhodothermaeota bacterium MED-G64]RPF79871.1 MAG: 50S ribosomal protein L32 [Rhodothermaceae bacterium TMED105]MDA0906786.1 50S ribosomal protein L32 [Bacteroidota bacterium]HBD42160.1 50S ribosomal protein L32 [Bacteroidota bacterium]